MHARNSAIEQRPQRVAAVPREERDDRQRQRRDPPFAAVRHARGDLHAEEEEQHVARRHEERDVAEPVFVEAPDEREEDLARGREQQAREQRRALRGRAARHSVAQDEPGHGVHHELAVRRPVLVDEQAERDRRDDHRVHERIIRLGTVATRFGRGLSPKKGGVAAVGVLPRSGTPKCALAGGSCLLILCAHYGGAALAGCDGVHKRGAPAIAVATLRGCSCNASPRLSCRGPGTRSILFRGEPPRSARRTWTTSRPASSRSRRCSRRAQGRLDQVIAAIDHLEPGVVLYGPDDRVVFCNRRFREIYAEVADLLVPGTSYAEIARAYFRRGFEARTGLSEEEYVRARVDYHLQPRRARLRVPARGQVLAADLRPQDARRRRGRLSRRHHRAQEGRAGARGERGALQEPARDVLATGTGSRTTSSASR